MGTEWRGGRERKKTTGEREKKAGTTAAREGNSSERVSVGMAATIRSALGLVTKKTQRTGVTQQRQEGVGEREKKETTGVREKKKGDDSGKGGELVGEGEHWDGGNAATIRSALCLVTKKNVTDGCRSPETKDKVQERQKMWRGQRRAVSGQKESQK